MNKFEKKLFKMSKNSNPKAKDWRSIYEQNFSQATINSKETAIKLRKKILATTAPLCVLVIGLTVLLLYFCLKPKPLPLYGEIDLEYSTLTKAQFSEYNFDFPNTDCLLDVDFKMASIRQTRQLALFVIKGTMETENDFSEITVIIQIMENVHFTDYSSYKDKCKELIKINSYNFKFGFNTLIDDTFYNYKAIGSFCSKLYYINIQSLSQSPPINLLSLLFP